MKYVNPNPIANHPKVYRADPTQRAVMSGGFPNDSGEATGGASPLADTRAAALARNPVAGKAPAAPTSGGSTLPCSSLSPDLLSRDAADALREAGHVVFRRRSQP